MPPRSAVAGIALFWLATTAYIAYRDVWPRVFATGPPPVSIELADEARQNVQVRWRLLRNGQKVGRLTTQMKYLDGEDAFLFTHRYTDLKLEQGGVTFAFSEVVSDVKMTRAGDLKGETIAGKAAVLLQGVELARGTIDVRAAVSGGVLTGRAELKNSAVSFANLAGDLDPVPVPAGLPLNTFQPVNRLAGVSGGRRPWVVHESNPLGDALGRMVQKKLAEQGIRLPERPREEPAIAEVGSQTQVLTWKGEEVACWVIEYRRAEPFAWTWVRADDGRVLKQEAVKGGERLTFERED